jgi:hypothetical protein
VEKVLAGHNPDEDIGDAILRFPVEYLGLEPTGSVDVVGWEVDEN